jgi:hypothetical protein
MKQQSLKGGDFLPKKKDLLRVFLDSKSGESVLEAGHTRQRVYLFKDIV